MSEAEWNAAGDRVEKRPYLSPRGRPERPLVEVFVVIAALYFTAYLPADASKLSGIISRPVFYLYSLAETVPGILLLLYLMASTDGLGAFKVAPPKAASFLRAAGLTAIALVLVAALSAVFKCFGIVNPLTQSVESAALAMLPLIILSSAATGYAEELCFRAYLLRRFEQTGLGTRWSIVLSTLVFASAHGAQGAAGPIIAAILGLLFAVRFSRAGDLNEIAAAHAAYNAIVFVIVLYP
jgi:membrane protease YdiL (CAAX protease family)